MVLFKLKEAKTKRAQTALFF